MKGRGTRTLGEDDLKKVTPSAKTNKTHFVIIDTVGVTKSLKTDSRPLDKKPTVPLKDLLQSVLMGMVDEATYLSLASRLTRLDKQLDQPAKDAIVPLAKGKTLSDIVNALLDAHNPDTIEAKAKEKADVEGQVLNDKYRAEAKAELAKNASQLFSGKLNEHLENTRKVLEQIIDTVNIDQVNFAGWDKEAQENEQTLINDFETFLEENKEEITALSIYYNQPYRRKEVTYAMIKELYALVKNSRPALAPSRVWNAYAHLDNIKTGSPKSELTALVGLLRRIVGIDDKIADYEAVARRNFRDWVVSKQAGHKHFTEEQMHWLHMIRDHVAASFHIEQDDFDLSPFGDQGGLGKMHQLFGNDTNALIDELNEVLVA
jgi:type I restriction enzyme R subunit